MQDLLLGVVVVVDGQVDKIIKYYTKSKEGLNAKRGFQKSFMQNAFKGKHGCIKSFF